MTSILPKQKISKGERTPKWYKDNVDYRIQQSNYWSGDRWEIARLYKAAAGELDPSEYKFALNPYNSTEENNTKYPAMMRNVDIISPVISSFMGEKANAPFNHRCTVANPDAQNIHQDAIAEKCKGVLAQMLVNQLNSRGVDTGVPTKATPPLEKILSSMEVSGADMRAIFGQQALEYIKYDHKLKDKFQECWYDFLVTGRAFTYKDVYKDDLLFEVVPPLELWHGTTRTGFIEDADWVLRKTRMNLSQIIDRFHKWLKPGEITKLEEKFRQGTQSTNNTFQNATPNIDKATNQSTSITSNSDLLDIYHVQWKGFVKVGVLTYVDQLGQLQEAEVSEEYELSTQNGDVSIEWEYHSCAFEAFKIGDEEGDDGLYICQRELPAQRNQLSNSSVVKLSYNGRVGYNERSTVNSVVKQLVPYQALYNIFHFRRELTLARNKDRLALFPIGLVPDEFGSGAEGLIKFLHFVETTSFLFFDEQKEGAMQVLNAIKHIDLSLGQYVAHMTDLLRSLKEEAWDAVGMNRQRYGDVNSSDGKGVNEQAIIRSAVITREIRRRFEKLEESDLQGLIEYSKLAWINGKKGMYINSDGRTAFLEVNPEMHADTEYGVFVIDSVDEEAKLKQGKDYAFGWAQKSTVSAGIVLDILDSNNMSSLKAKVKEAEKVQREFEVSREDAAMQNQQALQDKKDQDAALEREKDIEVAHIQAGATMAAASMRGNGQGETEQPMIEDTYSQIIDRIRKEDLANQKAGQKMYNDLSDKRFKEADLAFKQEKLAFDKTKRNTSK